MSRNPKRDCNKISISSVGDEETKSPDKYLYGL